MGGGDVPDAETLQVRKRIVLTTINSKGSFYQDRLGTNIRKALKTDGRFLADALASLLRAHSRPYDGGACCVVSVVAFELQFYHS